MEGYALCKVCNYLNKKFISIKYVTDNCDEKKQNKNVKNCTEMFTEFLKNYLLK